MKTKYKKICHWIKLIKIDFSYVSNFVIISEIIYDWFHTKYCNNFPFNVWEVLYLQYFHNIFTTNYRWLVVISFNLYLPLNYLFVLSIITSNNLSLKICCENVVNIAFLLMYKIKELVKKPSSILLWT